jgi:glucose-1-phosphate thymidylyltransferase
MKGLICAGGHATRLQELTRVLNKHLLPVGHWPMIYYPLQQLQQLGVEEVLLVTGQQHGGQFIDLLGGGHVTARDGDELLFDLDLSYKVQTEPGGIAQVIGMAEKFAAPRSTSSKRPASSTRAIRSRPLPSSRRERTNENAERLASSR